ncbi:hypothetical protein ACLQ2S_26225 [Micromonospora sp. DT48]|uniref:hypothetical protein n=1 Tax=Micromonospora sp. DT48 TaxID=3393429 RepID=UPI003CEADDF1
MPRTEPTHLVVSLSGRLTFLDTVDALTDFHRRTQTGTTYRIELGDGLAVWLDGDVHPAGDINWAASHMATDVLGKPYACPWDAPFLCGPVIFTGARPGAGLTEEHLALLVDAHAAAEQATP